MYLWIAFFFSTFASLFQKLVVLGTLLALMKTNSIDNRKKKKYTEIQVEKLASLSIY